MSTLKQLVNVMVPVRDQDAAIAFYTEKLGLEKRADIPFDDGEGGGRWIEVGPPDGAALALTPERGDQWTAGRMTGVTLVAGDDIDAVHARLKEAGVDVDEEILRIPGPPPDMFWFRDADGNQLLIVSDDRDR